MRSPLDDDIPSGRLLRSTPTSNATLTPPCEYCESENEGLWYAVEDRAEHDRERRAGTLASLRNPCGQRRLRRSSHQSPMVKAAAPTSVNRPTSKTSVDLQGFIDQLERDRADQQASA